MNNQTTSDTNTKLVLVANTQYRENYGSHDWDGVGVCPQYWKNKGGSSLFVAHLSAEEVIAASEDELFNMAYNSFDAYSTDYAEEFVIGYTVMTQEEFNAYSTDFYKFLNLDGDGWKAVKAAKAANDAEMDLYLKYEV